MHKLKHKQNSHPKAQCILSLQHESATKFRPASPIFKSHTLPTDAYSRHAVPWYCSSSVAMSFKATLSLYSYLDSLITTQKLMVMGYLLFPSTSLQVPQGITFTEAYLVLTTICLSSKMDTLRFRTLLQCVSSALNRLPGSKCTTSFSLS